MNIFFDLDGTLIDSKLRLYNLFQHLVVGSNLTYDEYWGYKQNKVSNQTILAEKFGYSESMIKLFVKEWMTLIEHRDFLKFDKTIAGVERILALYQQEHDLYLCTARQHKHATLEQLELLDLKKFFQQILVTEQKHTKDELICNNVSNLNSSDWFIGDTGHDIQVGKKLNVKTCAVLSGFLSREVLVEYQPDALLGSVADFQVTL